MCGLKKLKKSAAQVVHWLNNRPVVYIDGIQKTIQGLSATTYAVTTSAERLFACTDEGKVH